MINLLHSYQKISLSLALFPFIGSHAQTTEEKPNPKPNILFILVDDMQASSIHALGNQDVYTPSIDNIIREGTTFTNTYTNGALCGALSMPSRAMLVTGRGLFNIQGDGIKIPDQHITFPQVFGQNGYRTFATGKWHSDHASFNRSFQEGDNIYFGGMHPYEMNGHCSPRLHHYDPTGNYKTPAFTGTEFSSKMYAEAAIHFLDSQKDAKQPFLAYVAFTSPHDPRNQLPDYGQKYKAETLSVPQNYLPQHPFDNGEMDVRDELIAPTPRSRQQVQKELAAYYGMISEVDVQIGRIMAKLEEIGKKENTIIVFASDNGLAVGRHGLLGKQNLYDHSVKVPLVILDSRFPESKGVKNQALCYLHDICPTLCEEAGIPIPPSVMGKSLKPVLLHPNKTHREELFLAYSNLQRAFIKDGYKYIIYHVNGKITEQLFDLHKDPLEQQDIFLRKNAKANLLKKLLSKKLKEEGDFCNLDTPNWWKDGHKLSWNEMLKLYIFDNE